MNDFALKLAKVGAKLAKVGSSLPKVGPKMTPGWRQDGPKPVKTVPTHNDKAPGRHQGGTEEAPRSTLLDTMPPGMPSNQIKDDRTKSTGTARAKGNGTRDDDRI